MEVARLRALQEKVQDTRSAEDELRAKRYQVRPEHQHSSPDLKPPCVFYSHQPLAVWHTYFWRPSSSTCTAQAHTTCTPGWLNDCAAPLPLPL